MVPLIVLSNWHGAPEPGTRCSIGATGRKELISLVACVKRSICKGDKQKPTTVSFVIKSVGNLLNSAFFAAPQMISNHFSEAYISADGSHGDSKRTSLRKVLGRRWIIPAEHRRISRSFRKAGTEFCLRSPKRSKTDASLSMFLLKQDLTLAGKAVYA